MLVAFGACSACVIDEVGDDEVGEALACEAARRWPRAYAAEEDRLLELVNDQRSRGGECDGVTRNPVADVETSPELRCAARLHATDLSLGTTLGHEGSDGSTTLTRVGRADYPGLVRHELLASDFEDAAPVLHAWLGSPPHCNAIFDRRIVEIGIGHSATIDGDSTAWVVLTGEPR
jgi:uncharacterized protein YkwD